MKILSIHIKDLASIEGEYLIDFEAEPLKGSGLFSITGPTGTGKSTILDALCLALFEQTPRYRKNVFKVRSVEELDPSEVRNLLRRGADDCFSEVIFLGNDQHRYSAKWSLRLNRNGNYASPEHTLEGVDVNLGKLTNKEVLPIIIEKIGLTFDQFTRTVLLAQNDFATFLKANEKDKSDLLEKLTGTEIYTKISIIIYNRMMETKKAYDVLNQQLSGLKLLSEEELEEVNTQLKVLLLKQDHYNKEKERLQFLLNQYENIIEVRKKLGSEIEKEKKVFFKLTIDLSNANKSLVEKNEFLKTLELKHEKINEELVQAQLLDENLKNKLVEVQKASEDYNKVYLVDEDLFKKITALQEEQKILKDLLGKAKDFLLLHKKEKVMFEQKSVIALYLRDIESIGANNRKLLNKITNIELGHQKDKKNLDILENERIKLLQQQQKSNKTLEEIAQRLKHYDFEQQQKLQDEQESILTLQCEDVEVWKKWCKDIKEKDKLIKEKEKTVEQLVLFQENNIKADKEVKKYKNLVNDQRKQLDEVQRLKSVSAEEMRGTLEEGKPCPVCGATIHPFVNEANTYFDKQENKERIQLIKLEAQLEKAQDALNISLRGLDKMKIEKAQQEKEWDNIVMCLNSYSEIYHHIFHDSNLPSSYSEKERDEQGVIMEMFMKRQEANLEKMKKNTLYFSQQQQQRTSLQNSYQENQENLNVLVKQQNDLQNNITQLTTNLQQLKAQQKENETKTTTLFALLDKMIIWTDWKESLKKNVKILILEINNLSDEWDQNEEFVKTNTHKIEVIEARLIELREQKIKSVSNVKRTLVEKEKTQHSFDDLKQQRQLLLKGRRVEDIKKVMADEKNVALKQKEDFEKLEREKNSNLNECKGNCFILEKQLSEKDKEYNVFINKKGDKDQLLKLQKDNEEVFVKDKEQLEFVTGRLNVHQSHLKERGDSEPKLQKLRDRYEEWNCLSKDFGNKDGGAFKYIAQSYTLKLLLFHANEQLRLLTPRYTLRTAKKLELDIIDREQANSVRTINSLSGGESFLVSLGLALGLSALSAKNLNIGSLFIDEGFGSLDAESLNVTLNTLEQLQAQGRKVGVISHAIEMRERINTQIKLEKKPNGYSKIVVTN